MKAQSFVSFFVLLGFALAPSVGAAAAADEKGTAGTRRMRSRCRGSRRPSSPRPAPPPKQEKQTGPTIPLEEFLGKKNEAIQKITDQQISQMQRLIRVTEDDDPQKADFYFRLAELYADKQRYYFFQEHSLDQKVFDSQGAQKAQYQQQQQQFAKEQEKWLLQAVATYIEASKFRKYARMDEVLFKLAALLQTVKKEDQAREFFHRLIKDYPNSKYVPEAYLSFGEYFFQKGEMDAALKFYERVEQFPKSPVYGYAVYKKGWCYINLADFRKALEIFVDVINIAKTGRGGDPRQNKALEREAKKDVVKAFARVPGANADKAWEFFRNVGGDFAPKMMEALGEIYWEQGMFGDSTKVYKKIIALNQTSPRLCEWQDKVVRNTLSQGTKRDQVQELGRLGLAFEHVNKIQGVKKDVLTECRNTFHDKTKELALVWHKEAQKTKNPDTYQLTKYVYKIYLDHFPREKGSLDMAFYYGEVLWVTESWKEAAEQYTKVVEMDPKGKYVKEAAYAAVLAWKNYLNISDTGEGIQDKGKLDDKSLKPKPIPEYQQKMIAAFDTYIKYVPDSDMLVKIKYRKARIFYEYNQFEQAVPLFKDIVDHHGKDELAVYSANLMLDALNAQGKTKEVIAYVDKFPPEPGPHEGSAVPEGHGDPEDRLPRHGGPPVQRRRQLQGVRPFLPCSRRVDARSPEARRAALQRRPVLPERAPHRPRHRRPRGADQDAPEGSAGAAGALPHRGRLAHARLVQQGGGVLRAVRHQVPGREGVDHRPRQRLHVPARPRQLERGGEGHRQLRAVLRRQEAAAGGRRLLSEGRDLRAAEPDGRARPPPQQLHRQVGHQGHARQDDDRSLPAG
jgi:TolA-binding protein